MTLSSLCQGNYINVVYLGTICFLYSGEQHPQIRTQTKKRWGPALGLWQGLVALARAKFRKQQRKIRSHKKKKTISRNTEQTKAVA